MPHLPPRLAETSSKKHLTPLERADRSDYEGVLRSAKEKSRNMPLRDDRLRKEHYGEKAS